jgi:hypothetical protein
MPFRGEHEVALGPGVFALTAERDGDARRSNAQGKSALLWALRFVLTGDHPHRTEDEWITDGEPEGGVDAELSDGTFVSRWRKRGDATRLKVVTTEFDDDDPPERMRDLAGDEAQAYLDRRVGFSKAEQLSTWWCEQGRADLFVNGDPGEATADVVRWCGVEPVRRAAKRVAEELKGLLAGDARLLAVAEQARLESDANKAWLPEDFAEWERARLEQLERLRTLASEAASESEKRRERQRTMDDAAKWAKLDAERLRLELLDPAPAAEVLALAQRGYDEASGKAGSARADVRAKEQLARGEFDGRCPLAGIQCPAKDQINADAKQARRLLAEAKELLHVAVATSEAAGATVVKLRELKSSREYADRRLAEVRPELERLRPSWETAEKLKASEIVDARTTTASNTDHGIEQLEEEIASMRRYRDLHQAAEKRFADSVASREALAPEIASRREALQILGPTGAQRQLAEGFLSVAARRANEDLAGAGVDLRVAFSWQRELPDLADVCAGCGQPLPSSRKVRACEQCGAQRGRKVEQKLRCVVAPKSGGMSAVAGVGVRLSTTAWLKERRASAWSVVVLDEPLAAVDAHNRWLVGRHLVAMLGPRYGVEQAFVSAHDPALLASLPRRIVVRGGERGSTVEVLA